MFERHNFEKATEVNVRELVTELRTRLGELPDQALPDAETVRNFIDKHFDYLQEHQKQELRNLFLEDEQKRSDEADEAASS